MSGIHSLFNTRVRSYRTRVFCMGGFRRSVTPCTCHDHCTVRRMYTVRWGSFEKLAPNVFQLRQWTCNSIKGHRPLPIISIVCKLSCNLMRPTANTLRSLLETNAVSRSVALCVVQASHFTLLSTYRIVWSTRQHADPILNVVLYPERDA